MDVKTTEKGTKKLSKEEKLVPRSWQWSSRFPVDGSRVQAFAVPARFFVSCSFLPSKIAAQSMVKKIGLVGCIRIMVVGSILSYLLNLVPPGAVY